MNRLLLRFIVFGIVCLVPWTGVAQRRAEPKEQAKASVDVEYRLILASEAPAGEKGKVDPRLRDIADKLKRDLRLDTFELVKGRKIRITEGTPMRENLVPNLFLSAECRIQSKEKAQLKAEVWTSDKGKRKTLLRSEKTCGRNELFVLAGIPYKKGRLVVALRITRISAE